MLSLVMLRAIMLSVIRQSVVSLIVMAPIGAFAVTRKNNKIYKNLPVLFVFVLTAVCLLLKWIFKDKKLQKKYICRVVINVEKMSFFVASAKKV